MASNSETTPSTNNSRTKGRNINMQAVEGSSPDLN